MNARCKRVTWLAAAWFSTVVPVCGTEQAGQAVTLHASRPSEIAAAESPADRTLFPTQVRPRQFLRMQAEGFAGTRACGVVYHMTDPMSNGMPLGGVNTGCIDLDTSCLLGYSTIFNTHVPRRGPMNAPILGLHVGGQTWVLCKPQARDGWGGYQPSRSGQPYTLWRGGKYERATDLLTPIPTDLRLDGVRTAREIYYWGHYPVADVEFQTDAPVGVGLRMGSLPAGQRSRFDAARSRFRGPLAQRNVRAAVGNVSLRLSRSAGEGGGRQALFSKTDRRGSHRRGNRGPFGLLRLVRSRQRENPLWG